MATRIEISCRGGRTQFRTSPGLLRAQRLHGTPEVCRVALVATTALLLGGDAVDLEVHVGAGARLELSDVAGTVAYHGRGRPASWRTRIELEQDAGLLYAGQPFIVADGADVTRSLLVEVASGASAVIRETLVLGREGQAGGSVCDRLRVRRTGGDLLVEDQRLDADSRRRPGLLGKNRVVDTVLTLGGDPGSPPDGAVRCNLLVPGSTLTRFLGRSLAESPLDGWWRGVSRQAVEFSPIRLPSVSSK